MEPRQQMQALLVRHSIKEAAVLVDILAAMELEDIPVAMESVEALAMEEVSEEDQPHLHQLLLHQTHCHQALVDLEVDPRQRLLIHKHFRLEAMVVERVVLAQMQELRR